MDLTFSPARFGDTDQFLAWERGLGWDVEITQLSPGANDVGFDHCILPGLLVGHFHARQAIQGRFALPPGMVLFVLFRNPQPLRWNGAELPPNLMGIVHPGRTHWVIQQPGWDCYEFMVSEELVRRTEIIPPSFFDQTADADRPILPLQPAVTQRFVRGLDRMFREIRSPGGSQPSAATTAGYYEFLLSGMRSLVDTGLRSTRWDSPRPTRRADLVDQAREYIRSHVRSHVSIDEVADALGVSYRSLLYAFEDTLGVSPYRYFLTERLHATRRLLKTGNTSVTDACLLHGFNTPSRFARQYRRLFGELPSDTAARLQRHANGGNGNNEAAAARLPWVRRSAGTRRR